MKRFSQTFVFLIVLILAIVWIAPLLIVIINACKSVSDYNQSNFWNLPQSWDVLGNIQSVLVQAQLGQGFFNSLIYGVVGAGIAILFAAFAAYAMAVLKVKWSFFWFLVIYSGTIFPFQMYLIPLFKLYSSMNLYDTFWGMMLFYIAICIPFCTFVLRNFYSTLPYEITEAAKLDGSSDLQIFFHIIVPQSIPPFLLLFLFQFTWIWNDLLFGLTLSQSSTVRPIMASLAALQGGESGSSMPVLLMGALLASVPTVALFFGLQKHFMKGLSLNTKM